MVITLLVFLHGFGGSPAQARHDYHLEAVQRRLFPDAALVVAPARKAPADPMPVVVTPSSAQTIILVAYSGAGRQAVPLLMDRRVCCVLLLDAIYQKRDALDYLAWSRLPGNHLVVIANGTYAQTRRWAPGMAITRVRDSHPDIPAKWLERGLKELMGLYEVY